MMEAVKRCSKCGAQKPLEAFSRNRRRKDGLSAWCRQCCQVGYLSRRPPGHQLRPHPAQRNRLSPDLTEKRCSKCATVKPIDEYVRDRREPDGRVKWCRPCRAAYDRARYQNPAVRERQREMHRRWYAQRREVERARQRAANEQLRTEILVAYGQRCRCCGEATREFLGIDHVNGGGTRHRKSLRMTGRSFYLWLKRHGFPQDEFRLLCHNCDIARGHHGRCPHERST